MAWNSQAGKKSNENYVKVSAHFRTHGNCTFGERIDTRSLLSFVHTEIQRYFIKTQPHDNNSSSHNFSLKNKISLTPHPYEHQWLPFPPLLIIFLVKTKLKVWFCECRTAFLMLFEVTLTINTEIEKKLSLILILFI